MNSSNYKTKDFVHLWLYTGKNESIIISEKKIKWANNLSSLRAEEYKHSGSFLRKFLSLIFDLDPLNIPIIAKLGRSLELPKEYGYVGLRHCNDPFLIG